MPFSPVILIAGVMTCFISSIVYEIVPVVKPRHAAKAHRHAARAG